jgi:glycerate 2-kinase
VYSVYFVVPPTELSFWIETRARFRLRIAGDGTINKSVPRKILIAPDKFKGTLTAAAAAEAIARGWHRVRPDDALELLPISDGGDGFGESLGALLGAQSQTVRAIDAAHRPCRTGWWWEPKSKTAIIESARVIGLAMLPPTRFHPFQLDTFGLGLVLRAAAKRGARRCIVGIGGSATNDGGFGLARALGWKFLNRAGKPILRWTELPTLAFMVAPRRRRWFEELIVAVDVQNRLLGMRGATRVYGPQKGLRPRDLEPAERSLRRLDEIFQRQFGNDFARMPGAGAAGGLGFGLQAFARARLEPGFDLFADGAKLDRRLRAADLVITGEGRLDASTFMGKGVGEIARRCRRWKIPCVALVGAVRRSAELNRLFTQVHALTDLTSMTKATAKPAYWLEQLAERSANGL